MLTMTLVKFRFLPIFLCIYRVCLYLIIDAFDFIQQRLRSKHFGVILFKVDALMVERLEVILLVLLPPDLVEASLGFPPLFLLGL